MQVGALMVIAWPIPHLPRGPSYQTLHTLAVNSFAEIREPFRPL
jgi:hypothetical protein